MAPLKSVVELRAVYNPFVSMSITTSFRLLIRKANLEAAWECRRLGDRAAQATSARGGKRTHGAWSSGEGVSKKSCPAVWTLSAQE